MTINSSTQEAHVDTLTTRDPIDQLIPPPRPWWTRLVVGLLIVGSVGILSALFGFGYLYPRPECCGNGGGDSMMTLTPDATAVTVTTYFFNSSGRDLEILSATADLPGALVLDINLVDDTEGYLPLRLEPLPAVIEGTTMARIAITFVPESCDDQSETWGTLDLDLDVVNRWLPSIDRTYTLPEPVATSYGLSVFPPTDDPMFAPTLAPLDAACALLDAAT
jgi:hypothetical protein